MEPKIKIVLLIILILIALVKLVVGCESIQQKCIKNMKYYCSEDGQSIKIYECGKWIVLRYKESKDGLDYLHKYFQNVLLKLMVTPGLQKPEEFCLNRAKLQYQEQFAESDGDLANKISQSSKVQETVINTQSWTPMDSTKLLKTTPKHTKLTISTIQKLCTNKDVEIEARKDHCTEQLIYHFTGETSPVIALSQAMLYINLNSYDDPEDPEYVNKVTARDYLIHYSEKIQLSRIPASDPETYCLGVKDEDE